MKIDYKVLDEYKDTVYEIEQLRRLIDKRREQASKLRKMKVTDTVSGGAGGKQHFKIEGIPEGDIAVQEAYIAKSEYLLQCKLDKLIELTYQTEVFITQIPTSKLRRIGMYRVLEGMTWEQVADKLTEEGYTVQSQTLRVLWTLYLNKCREADALDDAMNGKSDTDKYTFGNA